MSVIKWSVEIEAKDKRAVACALRDLLRHCFVEMRGFGGLSRRRGYRYSVRVERVSDE